MDNENVVVIFQAIVGVSHSYSHPALSFGGALLAFGVVIDRRAALTLL